MTESEFYVQEGTRFLRPFQRWLLPPGKRSMWRFRVFGALASVHRWLWVRGVEL